jgi:hypothetical protein
MMSSASTARSTTTGSIVEHWDYPLGAAPTDRAEHLGAPFRGTGDHVGRLWCGTHRVLYFTR